MKFKPVAWLTAFYTLLGAIVSANQLIPIIPDSIMGIIGFVGLVLGIVLGVKTFNAVTPLARPRNAAGEPLKPKWARDERPSGSTGPRTMYGQIG